MFGAKSYCKTFDNSLTDEQNMAANKYKKIYDCGNMIFEYNAKR